MNGYVNEWVGGWVSGKPFYLPVKLSISSATVKFPIPRAALHFSVQKGDRHSSYMLWV